MKRALQWCGEMRRNPTLHRWHIFYAIFPFAVLAVYLAILYLALPKAQFWTFGALGLAYLFPPAGKETVIPLMVIGGLPWWLAAISIMLFDLMGALFIIWNFPLALRIPWFGSWAERFMSTGREQFDRYPVIEHISTVGLAFFVMIPFEGSGGVAASLIGRMLGMDYLKILVSVGVGSLLSASAIALSADFIISLVESGIISGIAGAGILIVAIVAVYIWGKRRLRNGRAVPEEKNSQ
ncbi:small multi-drug export protein [Methanogenium organophilum]|uniref:Small multi-drug export protein n=1 Tax=Methanogenium organophilum TaxID=2199 RepID=A0A9X9T7R8_METOG|nr:small multi-drug export protein [Methanogenium organophilum]WAI00387.1 small multi-drug export protein [Methanogenium organophilum]